MKPKSNLLFVFAARDLLDYCISTLLGAPIGNQQTTATEPIGVSVNNLLQDSTNTIPGNSSANNLFFEEGLEVHQHNRLSQMDCLHDTLYSDLEPSYSSSSDLSQNEATICETGHPSTSQPTSASPTQAVQQEQSTVQIQQFIDQNHNNSMHEWYNPRTSQLPPSVPDAPNRMSSQESRRRNLRSSRRHLH